MHESEFEPQGFESEDKEVAEETKDPYDLKELHHVPELEFNVNTNRYGLDPIQPARDLADLRKFIRQKVHETTRVPLDDRKNWISQLQQISKRTPAIIRGAVCQALTESNTPLSEYLQSIEEKKETQRTLIAARQQELKGMKLQATGNQQFVKKNIIILTDVLNGLDELKELLQTK